MKWKVNFITVLAGGVIGAGLWVAVMGAIENVRFAKGSGQILAVVSSLREVAANDAALVTQQETDLLLHLSRIQRLTKEIDKKTKPATLMTAWKQPLTVRLENQQARTEVAVPSYVCRRLTEFMGKGWLGLGLRRIEARDETNLGTRLIYERALDPGQKGVVASSVVAGCGRSDSVVLTAFFALR